MHIESQALWAQGTSFRFHIILEKTEALNDYPLNQMLLCYMENYLRHCTGSGEGGGLCLGSMKKLRFALDEYGIVDWREASREVIGSGPLWDLAHGKWNVLINYPTTSILILFDKTALNFFYFAILPCENT